jgi:hypothetical protein
MKLIKKILLILLFILPLLSYPQDSVDKKKRKVAQQKELKDAEALKKYQKAVKRQHKIQGKDTRKHMKKSLKKSQNISKNKKTFFIKRWFEKR